MVVAIRDWPQYMKQLYDHTRPGGYVEIVEPGGRITTDDDSMPADSGIYKFFNVWMNIAAATGIRVITSSDHLVPDLQEAGFEDIQVGGAGVPLNHPEGLKPYAGGFIQAAMGPVAKMSAYEGRYLHSIAFARRAYTEGERFSGRAYAI